MRTEAVNFADYFQRDSESCGGETVFKGTRGVTLRTALVSLAEGSLFAQILDDYPSLYPRASPGSSSVRGRPRP